MAERDPSKASRATLERLAEALHQWDDFAGFLRSPGITGPRAQAMREALAAWRAETAPPLRTRAEVDADKVRLVDAICARDGGMGWNPTTGERIQLQTLCREPTREPEAEPEATPYIHEYAAVSPYCKTPEPIIDGDYPEVGEEPEPCSCEESLEG